MVLQLCNKEWFTYNISFDKGKHNQISLHEQKRVQITTIECQICEQRDMFTFGQVNVKVDNEENILILCRGCFPLRQSDKIKWDQNDQKRLIRVFRISYWKKERNQILEWLLQNGQINTKRKERINQDQNWEILILELHQSDPLPNYTDEGYTFECIWVLTTFKECKLVQKSLIQMKLQLVIIFRKQYWGELTHWFLQQKQKIFLQNYRLQIYQIQMFTKQMQLRRH
ncbi:unnamed protein product [Paramecium sonneborni]|uniref:Upf1 domain-containing protein n=1 Tax=Paramecium sonneborni TaxID=65129 RepID=A0A8S1RQI8_9CILI|nr:unnamed protein product [Paramecium sonneborni]